jgi:hypothetical protein
MGCNQDPPQDVAHVQFQSAIAFKLVWSRATNFKAFVLVDDDGELLNVGWPLEPLPHLRERQMNYQCVENSKYALEADKLQQQQSAQ